MEIKKLLCRLRALLPKLRIVWDYSEVDAILRDRDWQMSMPALVPLLGDGVIMATGAHHTALRRQIGQMPILPDLHAIVRDFEPAQGPCDLSEQMTALVERVLGALFGDPEALRGAGKLVRKCVALAPFRLLGLPLDWPWMRKLNCMLANLPALPWMRAESMTDKERRDMAASFVVAGIDTLSAELTAQLSGVKLMPIYWLPRKHSVTGEYAIVLLSEGHKFGGGFRRCAGEHVARELVRLVLERWRFALLPGESDLRPVGVITQRLAKVTGVLVRRDDRPNSRDSDLP